MQKFALFLAFITLFMIGLIGFELITDVSTFTFLYSSILTILFYLLNKSENEMMIQRLIKMQKSKG